MKRIDIYTIDIGGGHIAPAMALKEQFDILGYKDLEVHVVNLGIALGASFLRYVYKFYWDKALRYPPLINAFYRGADNPFLIKILDRILGITILPKFVRYLEREKPDIVVDEMLERFFRQKDPNDLRRKDHLPATSFAGSGS